MTAATWLTSKPEPSISGVEIGDRALLGEVVDPGAVEADDVAERARSGADDDLVAGIGVGTADQRDLDAGILRFEVIHDAAEGAGGQLGLPPLDELEIGLGMNDADGQGKRDCCRLHEQHRFQNSHHFLPG